MGKSFRYTESEQNDTKRVKQKQLKQQRQAKKLLRQGAEE